MATNKEKIKALISDEEKVKALTDDKEFMDKIKNNTATPETYHEFFKKLGVKLSIDEAKSVKDKVIELLKMPTNYFLPIFPEETRTTTRALTADLILHPRPPEHRGTAAHRR